MYSKNTWKSGDIITAVKMNNINDGIDEASVHPLDKITTGTETSCDSYTTAGLYWLLASTVTDTPNGGAGLLIVTTNPSKSTVYQTFITYNTGNGYMATRCYTNSRWYGWDQRPAPADYVTSQGTSGAWFYRIWASGRKECWLRTGLETDITFTTGSLYASGIITYAYPITFTEKPTVYVGLRSAYSKPIWGMPGTPSTGSNLLKNAYLEIVTVSNTAKFNTDIYIYACGT